jgi:hypothetical protein
MSSLSEPCLARGCKQGLSFAPEIPRVLQHLSVCRGRLTRSLRRWQVSHISLSPNLGLLMPDRCHLKRNAAAKPKPQTPSRRFLTDGDTMAMRCDSRYPRLYRTLFTSGFLRLPCRLPKQGLPMLTRLELPDQDQQAQAITMITPFAENLEVHD